MSQWFNLEAALETNGVTKSDVKEVIIKQFESAPKRKDDEKSTITQMIGLIRPSFSSIKLSLKLSLKLLEFKWEKVIITLHFLLTSRAWGVILVYPHSISVSAVINYTNMAATSHVKPGFSKSKVSFLWIWILSWRKN